MADWFLGEIRLFPYTRVPEGWVVCDGAILPINQYQALYSLLGYQFGGDGMTTFALPDLRGRVPVASGENYNYRYGIKDGAESVTLTVSQMPAHTHRVAALGSQADSVAPGGGFPAHVGVPPDQSPSPPLYNQYNAAAVTALSPATIGSTGNTAAHENRQPTIAMVYCIATKGYYPPRSN